MKADLQTCRPQTRTRIHSEPNSHNNDKYMYAIAMSDAGGKKRPHPASHQGVAPDNILGPDYRPPEASLTHENASSELGGPPLAQTQATSPSQRSVRPRTAGPPPPPPPPPGVSPRTKAAARAADRASAAAAAAARVPPEQTATAAANVTTNTNTNTNTNAISSASTSTNRDANAAAQAHPTRTLPSNGSSSSSNQPFPPSMAVHAVHEFVHRGGTILWSADDDPETAVGRTAVGSVDVRKSTSPVDLCSEEENEDWNATATTAGSAAAGAATVTGTTAAVAGTAGRMQPPPPRPPVPGTAAPPGNGNLAAAAAATAASSAYFRKQQYRNLPDGWVRPKAAPKLGPNGRYLRPSGRKPNWKEWNDVAGVWVPSGTVGSDFSSAPAAPAPAPAATGRDDGAGAPSAVAPKQQQQQQQSAGPAKTAGATQAASTPVSAAATLAQQFQQRQIHQAVATAAVQQQQLQQRQQQLIQQLAAGNGTMPWANGGNAGAVTAATGGGYAIPSQFHWGGGVPTTAAAPLLARLYQQQQQHQRQNQLGLLASSSFPPAPVLAGTESLGALLGSADTVLWNVDAPNPKQATLYGAVYGAVSLHNAASSNVTTAANNAAAGAETDQSSVYGKSNKNEIHPLPGDICICNPTITPPGLACLIEEEIHAFPDVNIPNEATAYRVVQRVKNHGRGGTAGRFLFWFNPNSGSSASAGKWIVVSEGNAIAYTAELVKAKKFTLAHPGRELNENMDADGEAKGDGLAKPPEKLKPVNDTPLVAQLELEADISSHDIEDSPIAFAFRVKDDGTPQAAYEMVKAEKRQEKYNDALKKAVQNKEQKKRTPTGSGRRKGGGKGGGKSTTSSSSKTKSPGGSPKEVYHKPAPDIGQGWTVKGFERQGGKYEGHIDNYWYTPKTQRKLRSRTECKRFLALLATVDGDEEKAYSLMKKGK